MRHKFVFNAQVKEHLQKQAKTLPFNTFGKEGAPAGPQAPAQPAAPAGPEILLEAGPEGPAACTDVGRVRPGNEDALLFAPGIYGVADGMGGHQAGEVASGTVRDALLEALKDAAPDPERLRDEIREANACLQAMQRSDRSCAGMGTTLTVLWAGADKLVLAHVGDSRAYRLRDGQLEQMTLDHSVVAEMVRRGLITPADAEVHPMRNVITRAVGTDAELEIDILTAQRKPGDLWLLCTDGLHGLVPHARMEEILKENAPGEAARLLTAAALEAGGRDNISLVIFPDREAAHD